MRLSPHARLRGLNGALAGLHALLDVLVNLRLDFVEFGLHFLSLLLFIREAALGGFLGTTGGEQNDGANGEGAAHKYLSVCDYRTLKPRSPIGQVKWVA
jgi:hypothetical protein